MRKIKFTNCLLYLAIIPSTMFLNSCKGEDGLAGVQGIPGTNLIGDLTGKVSYVYDEYGNVMKNKSGVTVSIEATTFTTTTDSTGSYTFKDLTTGTYNLIMSKTGFGTSKVLSFPFVGGITMTYVNPQVYGGVSISKIPSWTVNNFKATVVSYDATYFRFILSSDLYHFRRLKRNSFIIQD